MSGVNYEVRVRAVSPIGAGEYRTATTSCMPLILTLLKKPCIRLNVLLMLYLTVPTTPIVRTSATTTSLYLQWTRSGGDTFTLYYWKNSTPSDVSTATTTSLSYNITGLDSNTAYKVIVSAGNSAGFANSSEVSEYTTPEGLYICSKQMITVTLNCEYTVGII